MTRLILIRHGETNWNVEHRKQGRNDQPLNEKGTAQAKLAADHVKANYNIAKVWSSPLQRCSNTAALFNLPVVTSEHLLEIDYGEWEGMFTAEIEAQQPIQTNASADELDPPGGELRSNLPVRARHWIAESQIAEQADQAKQNEDVVLVGHGGAMKGLLVALLDLPDQAMNTLVIDNCSISVVDINPNPKITNRLVALNHTAHLNTASD